MFLSQTDTNFSYYGNLYLNKLKFIIFAYLRSFDFVNGNFSWIVLYAVYINGGYWLFCRCRYFDKSTEIFLEKYCPVPTIQNLLN